MLHGYYRRFRCRAPLLVDWILAPLLHSAHIDEPS